MKQVYEDKKWTFEDQFNLNQKLNDLRFGDIIIHKHKENQDLIFSKDQMFTSKDKAWEYIKKLLERIQQNHPNSLKFLGYTSLTQKNLCSTTFQVRSFYEFPKLDMEQQKSYNKEHHIEFLSSELERMAIQCISALDHMHSYKQSHRNIRPQLIGKEKSDYNYLLMEELKYTENCERIQMRNLIDEKPIYMSPEFYSKLEGNNKEVVLDDFKNDIFSLGITILELGIGHEIKECYQKNGVFNQDLLMRFLNEFDVKHKSTSPHLSKSIWIMTEMDQNQRDLAYVLSSIPVEIRKKHLLHIKYIPSQQQKDQEINVTYSSPKFINSYQEPYRDSYLYQFAQPTDSNNTQYTETKVGRHGRPLIEEQDLVDNDQQEELNEMKQIDIKQQSEINEQDDQQDIEQDNSNEVKNEDKLEVKQEDKQEDKLIDKQEEKLEDKQEDKQEDKLEEVIKDEESNTQDDQQLLPKNLQ